MNRLSVRPVISSTPPMRMIALWNSMLAREYSLSCSDGSSWNTSTSACSAASSAPVTRGAAAADMLADFLTALHQPAPAGAPAGRGRGGPLATDADGFAGALAKAVDLGLIPDPDAVQAIWDDAVAAPDWPGPPLWLHGDLHPANLLTADGTYCGVIDFGDMCAGDPACDLAAAWILLPHGAADRCHQAYRPTVDPATLRRARGSAIMRAVVCILIGDAGDHGRPGGKSTWGPPAHAALGRLTATNGA